MNLRHFDPVKRVAYVVICGLITVYILISVLASQVAGPYYFRFANREPGSILPVIKAVVATGDLLLLKSAFGESVNMMHERVFEQYVSQDNMKESIALLDSKIPESRDLEISKGYIAARENDFERALLYFNKAKEIDPLVFVPIGPEYKNSTSSKNSK